MVHSQKNSLDLLASIRGVSAIIVAVVHAFQIFVLPYFGLYGWLHLGTSFLATYAVIAFFIVSGFMIYISISRHQNAAGEFNAKSFLVARILRIYPPLIAAIIVSFFVFFVVNYFDLHGALTYRLGNELFLSRDKLSFEWDRLLPTVLLLYNVFPGVTPPLSIDGPLWSLSYEWWFYIFAMVAFSLKNRLASIKNWIMLVLVAFILFFQPSGVLFWVLLATWLAGFFVGFLYKAKSLDLFFTFTKSAVLCFVFALSIFFIGDGAPLKYVIEPLQRLGNKSHLVMMFIGFFMAVVLANALKMNLKGCRFMVAASNFSYTLYLVHFPLLLLAFSFMHPIIYPLGWVASTVAALLSLLIVVFISANISRIVEDRNFFAALFRVDRF